MTNADAGDPVTPDDGPHLPPGWTIDRIRAMGVNSVVEAPNANRFYVVEAMTDDLEEVAVDLVVNFGELVLVRYIDDAGWRMGSLVGTDEVLIWSGSYGPDLADAIRGL